MQLFIVTWWYRYGSLRPGNWLLIVILWIHILGCSVVLICILLLHVSILEQRFHVLRPPQNQGLLQWLMVKHKVPHSPALLLQLMLLCFNYHGYTMDKSSIKVKGELRSRKREENYLLPPADSPYIIWLQKTMASSSVWQMILLIWQVPLPTQLSLFSVSVSWHICHSKHPRVPDCWVRFECGLGWAWRCCSYV